MAKRERKKSLVQWADGSRDAYVEKYQEVSKTAVKQGACSVSDLSASRDDGEAPPTNPTDVPAVAEECTSSNPLYFPPAEGPSSARQVLDEAVSKLSSQQSKVWQLCMVMGKTVRDASVVLKVGVSTVQMYLERSRRHVVEYCQANQYRVA